MLIVIPTCVILIATSETVELKEGGCDPDQCNEHSCQHCLPNPVVLSKSFLVLLNEVHYA